MRGDCAMCGRGRGISTGPQHDACLTSPHGVYSLPGFPHGVCLSDPMYGIRQKPLVKYVVPKLSIMMVTASISFHVHTTLLLY